MFEYFNAAISRTNLPGKDVHGDGELRAIVVAVAPHALNQALQSRQQRQRTYEVTPSCELVVGAFARGVDRGIGGG